MIEENSEMHNVSKENIEVISENWLERLIGNIKDNPAILEDTKKQLLSMLEGE